MDEAIRFIEDILSDAWRRGGEGKGIDVSEKAEEVMSFLKRLGYGQKNKKAKLPNLLLKWSKPSTGLDSAQEAQQDMLKAGFHKDK